MAECSFRESSTSFYEIQDKLNSLEVVFCPTVMTSQSCNCLPIEGIGIGDLAFHINKSGAMPSYLEIHRNLRYIVW